MFSGRRTGFRLAALIVAPSAFVSMTVSADVSVYRAARAAAAEKGARAYVSDGLVAHWDGIENVAYGQPHDSTSKRPWKDLTGNRADIDTSNCTWDKGGNAEALHVNGYWNKPKMAVFDGTLPTAHTVEICLRTTSSAGTGYIAHGLPFFIVSHNPGSGNPGLLYARPCFGGYGLSNSTSYGGNYHFSPLRGATYTVSHSGDLSENFSCYISGALTKRNTPKSLSAGSGEACLASGSSNESTGLTGYYYSIRIYDRVLTDEEVYWNSIVDNTRFTTLDTGCITADNSSNVSSTAYSAAIAASPHPYDVAVTEGIGFSSKAFRFSLIIR